MSTPLALTKTVEKFLDRDPSLLIDGEWRPASGGRTIPVVDPATGRTIAHSAEGTASDIDAAVIAARQTFDSRIWRSKSGAERSEILWQFASMIAANSEELLQLEILDSGMPYAFGAYCVRSAAEWIRHFSRLAANISGRNVSDAVSGERHFHAYSASEPVGVVGLITPWNGPIFAFALKVSPALAAGCSAVFKPAENTPLTALRLGELAIQAGIPRGVLNIVTGYGHVAGAALAEHPDVDKISFTGSTSIGKGIVRASAGNLKRVSLELGGKSPCVIFDDADMDVAIPSAAMGIFANTGQVCFAGSRLFVQRKSFDRVVSGIADFAKSMRIGSGLDPENNLGPLISAKQLERVMEYIAIGKAEGAELVTGGKMCRRDGFFVEPTLFADVKSNMRITKEEIFGPVLVVTPFDDIDEVVKAANDTRYGLAAGIFTSDLNKCHYLASRIEAGNIWVNCYGVMHPAMPFGGYKESGWGREAGAEGLDAFLEKKAVVIQLKI